jgi:hypothetical protein
VERREFWKGHTEGHGMIDKHGIFFGQYVLGMLRLAIRPYAFYESTRASARWPAEVGTWGLHHEGSAGSNVEHTEALFGHSVCASVITWCFMYWALPECCWCPSSSVLPPLRLCRNQTIAWSRNPTHDSKSEYRADLAHISIIVPLTIQATRKPNDS